MNRYQFEDLISEYLENELSFSKRKEFEAYMNENPDAQALVKAVGNTMSTMNRFSTVSVSENFNEKLMARVRADSSYGMKPTSQQKTWFGFTPIHASLMTGLVLAFGFISMQLFSPDASVEHPQQFMANESVNQDLSTPMNQTTIQPTPNLADVEEDSTIEDQKPPSQKDFSKKIHYVND